MTAIRPDATAPVRAAATTPPDTAAPDKRPTIVFLHGTRLTGSQWAVQAATLSDEFHCLAVDLPGHGVAAGIPFDVDDAADRVAAIIEADAYAGRAIVVGLSLGGFVAMALAARHPERVSALVVVGASGEPTGVRSFGYRLLGAVFQFAPLPVLERANRAYFSRRYPTVAAEPILSGGFWFRGGAAAVRSLVGQQFRPRLAAYPGPTLLINGELDLVFRPTARSFADVAVDARRVVIRRATHLVNLDQPEAFTAALRRFARETSRPPVVDEAVATGPDGILGPPTPPVRS